LPSFPNGVTTSVDITGAAAITFYREDPSNVFSFVAGDTFIINSTAPSSVSAPLPVFGLEFSLPAGILCDFNLVEASFGSWIQLPAASDCVITPPAGDATYTLLGWATSADFSVSIAQRQVNNGWGAYETYNDDGQLTGVFIPAGGYTLVSNDTNLYPIFSN